MKPPQQNTAEGEGETPEPPPERPTSRKWKRKPTKNTVIVGVAALLIGGVAGGFIGATITRGEADDRQERIDALSAELAEAESAVNDLDDREAAFQELMDETDARIRREADKLKARAQRMQNRLDRRSNKLDKREIKIASAEATIKRNTFGDGIWQVGVDFDAGTYRATGADCYWEKLSKAGSDFDSLLENNSGPNQTVTIDSAWFSSQGCGKWQKVE